jgi:hypothetical protein
VNDGLRWDQVPAGTLLGQLVAPYAGMGPDELGLHDHLVGNGTIQLFNPGFDEHLIGPGLVPWFGFGHCALLAWHLHLKSGWQLVTLGPGATAPMVHTAVQAPDGRIVDWRGAQDPTEAVNDYTQHLYQAPDRRTWRWAPNPPDEWIERWVRGRCAWPIAAQTLIEIDGWNITMSIAGRQQRISPYSQFEITLADFLAEWLIHDARCCERTSGPPHLLSVPTT